MYTIGIYKGRDNIMAEQYIQKIRTEDGDLQIDYTALANLPKPDATLSQSGSFADAKATGDSIAAVRTSVSTTVADELKNITPASIGASASDHTHKYAGSSSVGGAATSANLLNAIAISSSANLNDYVAPTYSGFYYCSANATAATLSNCPTTKAFFMIVGRHAGTYQYIIEHLPSGSPKMYFRNYYNTWGSWYQIYSEASHPPYPVTSVNGKTGAATLSASDVGASASSHTHTGMWSLSNLTFSESNGVLTITDKQPQ